MNKRPSQNIEIIKELTAVREAQAYNTREFVEMRVEIKEMRTSITALQADANRFKGAFIFALSIGGFLGWFVSSWDKIKAILAGA